MKPRTKNILVVIAILAVTFITNTCNAQDTIKSNFYFTKLPKDIKTVDYYFPKYPKHSISIQPSYVDNGKKYFTVYRVIKGNRSYYTNYIVILDNKIIEFSCYKRNGELLNSYSFELKDCLIYMSKE